ncbi:thiosulfate/3-mercaptopyruvate sulfurtransferase [Cyclobacterium lianum]|uniref:Thiosulfate/3-mercaptopyruvate sulfurtransferase n=1 Tax=Cyclobacterium lianum TaxID=388280 RepID=A0A1M7Q6C3_9BACT|nr:sulfurtransferase [Cyclobacterium lianum]SHN26021.1 thiosulfate/3-mercaptopyruvate sulfurtransferase [Cyclobacterium lianum]
MTSTNPVISPKELLELKEDKQLVLIDASFDKKNYETIHLQGALHVDLNRQLSEIGEDAAFGGRHPLPQPEEFAKTLGVLGIRPESHVVVYDDKYAGMSAARFWWMLRALGHDKVQVLDGGKAAAIKAGFPVSQKIEVPEPQASYPVSGWQLPLADLEEVEIAATDRQKIVLDVREAERYLGIAEPIDLIAGHIPGAVNIPFSENLDDQGSFLSPDELKKKYASALARSPDEVIVHCGSGVTACHTLLAMAHAGLPIPKLYVGSWSEWSRNNLPVAKGNE